MKALLFADDVWKLKFNKEFHQVVYVVAYGDVHCR